MPRLYPKTCEAFSSTLFHPEALQYSTSSFKSKVQGACWAVWNQRWCTHRWYYGFHCMLQPWQRHHNNKNVLAGIKVVGGHGGPWCRPADDAARTICCSMVKPSHKEKSTSQGQLAETFLTFHLYCSTHLFHDYKKRILSSWTRLCEQREATLRAASFTHDQRWHLA